MAGPLPGPPAERGRGSRAGVIGIIAGALALLWIGVKLLAEDDDGHDNIDGGEQLWSAIRTIIVADVVMSMDNVVAVASAADQANADYKIALVAFGIVVSIPIVV